MTGQISGLPLELVAVVVAASMIIGAVDILRQPGWAWKQASEPKVAYLILDLILPVIGVAMYAFRARPKVVAEVAAGLAAPVEAAPAEAAAAEEAPTQDTPTPPETGSAEPATPTAAVSTDRFTGFREMADNGYSSGVEHPSPEDPDQFEISSTFFSTGASSRTIRHPLALARAYRPRQRTSLTEDQPEPAPDEVTPPEPDQAPVLEFVAEPARAVQPAPTPTPTPVAEPEPEPEPAQAHVLEFVAGPADAVKPDPPAVSLIFNQAPTVPSGWKVDPTGRHQFRYWDGFNWTENVADNGQEALDAVSA